jgi:hypothetical protein
MARVDVGTLENVFENDLQNVPKTISQEKAVEVAGRLRDNVLSRGIGAIESRGFRKSPLPFWLFPFFGLKGPIRQMFLVILRPDACGEQLMEANYSKRSPEG